LARLPNIDFIVMKIDSQFIQKFNEILTNRCNPNPNRDFSFCELTFLAHSNTPKSLR
jgi:hypothetical protein